MAGNVRPPRTVLDLGCGVGGASVGYWQAWRCRVIGVDVVPQPNYPFEFVHADYFEFLTCSDNLAEIEFIHASPPCKRWAAFQVDETWPDHITPLRQCLYRTRNATGRLIPWVMENVVNAPLRRDIQLCGTSLGLTNGKYELQRHRYFEFFPEPVYMRTPWCNHDYDKETVSIWGRSRKWIGYEEVAQDLMQMPWAKWSQFRDSIPPAYTRWIARRLLLEP